MLAAIASASHLASNPAVAGQASHPAVAVWFALGAAALAAVVVAMAWSVHARQIRLAELLVRRQFPVIADAGGPGRVLGDLGHLGAVPRKPGSSKEPAGPGRASPRRSRGRTIWSPASRPGTGSGPPAPSRWCRGRSAGVRCLSPPTRLIPTSCC
jgi:hypothetical protein